MNTLHKVKSLHAQPAIDDRRLRDEFEYCCLNFFADWDYSDWQIGWLENCPLVGDKQPAPDNGHGPGTYEFRETIPGRSAIVERRESRQNNPHHIAQCRPHDKVILISHDVANNWLVPQFRSLLSHEICHAVLPPDAERKEHHSRPWQDRMRQTADRARDLKQPFLAWFLEMDVKREVASSATEEKFGKK